MKAKSTAGQTFRIEQIRKIIKLSKNNCTNILLDISEVIGNVHNIQTLGIPHQGYNSLSSRRH